MMRALLNKILEFVESTISMYTNSRGIPSRLSYQQNNHFNRRYPGDKASERCKGCLSLCGCREVSLGPQSIPVFVWITQRRAAKVKDRGMSSADLFT